VSGRDPDHERSEACAALQVDSENEHECSEPCAALQVDSENEMGEEWQPRISAREYIKVL
jgi:hypothetical protein